VSVGCLLSELSGTDEVTLVGTESHSESCTTHGVCKAIVEVAKDGQHHKYECCFLRRYARTQSVVK
jgi:hypothetical protein